MKNSKRFDTLKQTRERRKSQVCKTFEFKIDKSKLSQKTKEDLNKLFLEAKWFYNHLLSQKNIFKTKIEGLNKIKVLNKDKKFETRKLEILPICVKREIKNKIITSIRTLFTKKKRKQKIGRLKFKSLINCVPYGWGYKIRNNGYLQLMKIKQYLKVSGSNQIPKEAEFSNILLIRKYGDYFIKMTTFLFKEESIEYTKAIGIDFGIKTQMAFSNGIKTEFKIPVSKRIIKFQKNLSRKTKGSHNFFKNQLQLQKAYDEINNIKKDVKNKLIHYLKNNYIVCVQNENIKAWQKFRFGKQINESAIGGIISGIKQIPETLVADRFFPSTKTCYNCGHVQKVDLSERVFVCKKCSYTEDRDINSARNILKRSFEENNESKIPAERREFTLVENETSTLSMLEYLNNIPHLKASLCLLKQEAIL